MMALFEDENGNRIGLLDSEDEVARLITLFESIADELGWQPGDRIQAYPRNSVYFAAYASGNLAGGIQLVVSNGTDPMPSSHVWPEMDPSERTDVAHAAIMALKKEYRGGAGLFGPLCVEMWRYCAANGISEIWMETVPAMLTLYRRIGWPLEVIAPLRPHWGEECYLCRMGVADVERSLRSRAVASTANARLVGQADRGVAPGRPLLTAA